MRRWPTTFIAIRNLTTEYIALHLRVLAPSESGRQTPFAGRPHRNAFYMPHLRVSTESEYLGVAFVDGPEWIHPGDEVDATVALIYSDTGVDYSPLVAGASIEVMEGPHVVARGQILRRWTESSDWRSRPSV